MPTINKTSAVGMSTENTFDTHCYGFNSETGKWEHYVDSKTEEFS